MVQMSYDSLVLIVYQKTKKKNIAFRAKPIQLDSFEDRCQTQLDVFSNHTVC